MPIPIIASPKQLKRDVFARSICLGTWCWRSVGPSPSCWLCWVARCRCWLDMLRWMLVMRSPLSEFSSARLVYHGIHAYAKVHDSVELAYWFGTRIVSLECLLTYCLFIWHCNPALLFPSMTKASARPITSWTKRYWPQLQCGGSRTIRRKETPRCHSDHWCLWHGRECQKPHVGFRGENLPWYIWIKSDLPPSLGSLRPSNVKGHKTLETSPCPRS